MAALLTSTSQRPNRRFISAMARAVAFLIVEVELDDGDLQALRLELVGRGEALLGIARADDRGQATVVASWRTISRPMPRLAPETRATRGAAMNHLLEAGGA